MSFGESRRRRDRGHRSGGAEIARRRRRQLASRRARHRVRRAGADPTSSTDRAARRPGGRRAHRPAARPSRSGGGSFGRPPSGRGTPGALGFCDGSNTSERRPVAGAAAVAVRPRARAGPGPAGRPCDRRCGLRRRWRAAGPRRGAASAAKLIFELLVAVLQLLDRAGHLADLRFEALDAQHLLGGRPLGFVLAGGLLRGFCPNMRPIADSGELLLLGGGGVRQRKARRPRPLP